MRPGVRTFLCVVLFLVASGPVARAEEPAPFVLYAYPSGGQRGTTVRVTVTGENVQGATGIRAAGTGISATLVRARSLRVPPNQNSAALAANSTVTFLIVLAPEAEVGLHELRLLSPGGVSNRFRFQVGQVPEILEKEPNSTRLQAQVLPSLPVTVNGQCQEGDRDCYRFAAKAGTTLVCQVDARSLIPYIADAVPGWNDACLSLYDSAGHELQTVDDFRFHPDPVVFFRVPADGEYVLEIRDVLLRGRGDFVYRLRIGEFPYLTDVFPLGGRRGARTEVALRGVNLPAERLDVPLPESGPDAVPVSAARDGIVSNAVPFGASDLGAVAEVEPDDTPDKAMRVTPPVVIDGRIDRPGDVDCFVFAATAGQKLTLEVCARRLDSPLDSILTLLGPKGQKLVENDDTPDPEAGMLTHQADSKVYYTAPAAGDLVVKLRDVQGKGGPEYAYRLTISPQRPDFALRVMPDNPHAARGDCALLTVTAIRKDGFADPIRIDVSGLPAGLVASPAVIPAGQDKCSLTVAIAADAALGMVTPVIAGTATVAGQPVERRALAAEEMTQSFNYKHLIPAEDLAFSVLEAGPYTLALVQPPAQPLDLAQGASVEVAVKVMRPAAAKAGVQLKPVSQTPGITVRGAFIPPEKDESVVAIAVAPKAPVGSMQNIIVTATVHAGREVFTRTLPAIQVRVIAAEPPKPPAQPKEAPQPVAPAKEPAAPAAPPKGTPAPAGPAKGAPAPPKEPDPPKK